MLTCNDLRDHAGHGPPNDMRPVERQGVEQTDSVVGHVAESIGRTRQMTGQECGRQGREIRRAALDEICRTPGVAVVETDHADSPVTLVPRRTEPPKIRSGALTAATRAPRAFSARPSRRSAGSLTSNVA